jgi:hypothetical protein
VNNALGGCNRACHAKLTDSLAGVVDRLQVTMAGQLRASSVSNAEISNESQCAEIGDNTCMGGAGCGQRKSYTPASESTETQDRSDTEQMIE